MTKQEANSVLLSVVLGIYLIAVDLGCAQESGFVDVS